jgi:hypothetical protein
MRAVVQCACVCACLRTDRAEVWRRSVCMGAYGANSMKPCIFWANVPWVWELDKRAPRHEMPHDAGVVALHVT